MTVGLFIHEKEANVKKLFFYSLRVEHCTITKFLSRGAGNINFVQKKCHKLFNYLS